MLQNSAVKIVSAQTGVPAGSKNLENTLAQFKNRKIECSAAEVVNRDPGLLLQFIQAVSQSSGGGFVDDAFNGEARQFTGPNRGVPLRIIEIGRNRNYRARYFLTKII